MKLGDALKVSTGMSTFKAYYLAEAEGSAGDLIDVVTSMGKNMRISWSSVVEINGRIL